MDNYLLQFLRNSANSVSREVMLFHRVAYDLKVASALSGFDLRVYRPDVDREGFDMFIEQRSIARPLQLKTVSRRSVTRSWTVHAHLLHPSRNRSERLGFTLPKIGLGDGLDGGVLLMDFDLLEDSLTVRYRFFDLAVAAAHACGHTGLIRARRDKVRRLLQQLRTAEGEGMVSHPGCSCKCRPRKALLSFLGCALATADHGPTTHYGVTR
jgi:hypothetical protein